VHLLKATLKEWDYSLSATESNRCLGSDSVVKKTKKKESLLRKGLSCPCDGSGDGMQPSLSKVTNEKLKEPRKSKKKKSSTTVGVGRSEKGSEATSAVNECNLSASNGDATDQELASPVAVDNNASRVELAQSLKVAKAKAKKLPRTKILGAWG
jgi:hypothetical protein